MSSILNALSAVAPGASNEVLGTVAAEFVKSGALNTNDLGRMLRPALGTMEAVGSNATIATKSESLPESPAMRTELLEQVYDAFDGSYNRRSLGALSRLTGLNANAVKELIAGNSDFRIISGRRSDKEYVKLNGLR